MLQIIFVMNYSSKNPEKYALNEIQVYLYSTSHGTNHCSFTENEVSTICLVVAYQWWLCQVDVHMAEMYSKNQLMM